MVSPVMTRAEYEAKYGPEFGRWRSEEAMRLWEEVKKLPAGSYRIFEPTEKGQALDVLRDHLKGKIQRTMDKLGCNFRVRFAINKKENHVVLWKEAKVVKG